MAEKRAIPHSSSCSHCYQKKLKCDLGNPCHHCVRTKVECIPVEVTNKRRKKRFPEAELLARIKRYEAALESYGADIEAINDGSTFFSATKTSASSSPSSNGLHNQCELGEPSTISAEQATSDLPDDPPLPHCQGDLHTLLDIIDGEQRNSGNSARVDKMFYERFFKDDGFSLLFTKDSLEIPNHPAPFDIFRLWQIYCDNVQPLCKILHIPTLQRKMTKFGTRLHQAPAADQALFFSMYLAATSTLGPDECQKGFNTSKQALQEQYRFAAQIWLRRAGFWKTSKLSVLQAFVLFLYTQQNVVDPRALATYTGMAERIARRIGLHRDSGVISTSFVEQEMQRRLWWELVFLDSRTLEKAGMGNLSVTGDWTRSLPSAHSDADLENIKGDDMQKWPPSSDMLFLLTRCETTRLSVDIRKQQQQQQHTSFSLRQKLERIDKVEDHINTRYLSYGTLALPHHQMTIFYTSITISRIRISAYLLEEAASEGSHQDAVRNELLRECNLSLEKFTKLRGDPALQKFQWFMMQYMPIYVYIHLLRLLQTQVAGPDVNQAWHILEEFRSQGVSLPVDSLILRAWRARQAGMGVIDLVEVPNFVKIILESSTTTLQGDSSIVVAGHTPPSDSDYMAMLADIMAGNTDYSFDWTIWLQESSDQTTSILM